MALKSGFKLDIKTKAAIRKSLSEYNELIETIAKIEFKKLSSSYLIDFSELINIGTQVVHHFCSTTDITNYNTKLRVEVGDMVQAGEKLTEGSIAPKELLAVTDPLTAQEYILKEIQSVYKLQGVDINDKHIEIIVKRMINKVRVVDAGDTDFVEGLAVSLREFTEGNKPVILRG